jgi:alpha-mannosidase
MNDKALDIFYFSSTHWDREWYQPFQGFRFRLVNMVNELIEILEKDTDFKVFHLDGQTIVLEDYLEIVPENKQRLQKLILEGRILVGPWYVMPDEFLLSGESLIRNLMMGHRISKELGAEAWKYGYVCDIFGHIAQMPQIFNEFGINYSLLGRGTNEHNLPAFFTWQSPDGSECITHKLVDENGYGAFCLEVLGYPQRTYEKTSELTPKIKKYIDYEIKRSQIPVVVVMDGMDHEKAHAETPELLRMIKEIYPHGTVHHENLEKLGIMLEKYKTQMPVKSGELNETAKKKGGFIHLISHTLSSRYPIKQANDICQTLLEKWMEPITTIAALKGFETPRSYVDLAYKYLIQNHPHDSICGCSIDQVHRDMEYRFDQVKLVSEQLVDECLNHELHQYKQSEASNERLLVLWNPLPFERKEVVTIDIDFNTDYPHKYQEPFGYEVKNSFKIFDYRGNEIPYGLVGIRKNHTFRKYNQSVEQVDLYTVSLEIKAPAMGRTELRLVPYKEASRYLSVMSMDERSVENEFIRLLINDNGTFEVYDKQSGINYSRLGSYVDDGEIGDGWFHVNPVEDRVVSSLGSECIIEKIENGPSRTVFKVTNYMKVPKEMNYKGSGIRRSGEYMILKITSKIGLSKASSHVDVETMVENNSRDHRLRLKLPTGISSDMYFVNQVFAFVNRKTGINIDTQDWKECEVPEKQMGGIVGKRKSDGSGLAFISAHGLHECAALDDEEGTVNITLFRSFNKTVMTNGEPGGQIQGELKFKYYIKPIQAETTNSDLIRLQDTLAAGMKFRTVRIDPDYELKKPQNFLKIEDGNICMSILKRPEDGEENKVIIRLYNLAGEHSKAKIESCREILEVEEVDLNEEFVQKLPCEGYSFEAQHSPWKLKTYSIRLGCLIDK